MRSNPKPDLAFVYFNNLTYELPIFLSRPHVLLVGYIQSLRSNEQFTFFNPIRMVEL
jgi:hypothetical protein